MTQYELNHFVLLMDNARGHISADFRDFLSNEGLRSIGFACKPVNSYENFPSNSSDLNTIENVFSYW